MNDIPAKQDSEEYQVYLRAARAQYGRAKTFAVVQLWATVAVPLALGVAAAVSSAIDPIAAAAGLVILGVDVVLSRIRRTVRGQGALAQEVFDSQLYGIEWNELVAGAQPRPALVKEWGQGLPADEIPKLKRWYPPCVGDLPLHAARVVCQHLNVNWDSRLRKRYATVVAGGTAMIALALLCYGVAVDPSTRTLLMKVVALAPAFRWALREWHEQTGVWEALDALEQRVGALWQLVLSGSASAQEMSSKARAIQDQLFDKRRDGPEVHDWLYRLTRAQDERLMENMASDMVAEFEQTRTAP